MTLKKFSNTLFHHCPLLSHWGDDHEQTFQNFLSYKTRVPVCGAIMLNSRWDKVCLLLTLLSGYLAYVICIDPSSAFL